MSRAACAVVVLALVPTARVCGAALAIAFRLRRYANFATPIRFVKPARSDPFANVAAGIARRRTVAPRTRKPRSAGGRPTAAATSDFSLRTRFRTSGHVAVRHGDGCSF